MSALPNAIQWIEFNARDPSAEAVLQALDAAIVAAGERIEEAKKLNDDEQLDFVVDSECEVLESLLGTAFVLSQTRITAICSAVLSAYDHLAPEKRAKLTFAKSKFDVLGVGPLVSGTTHSEVTAINALANYFKHRDEWPGIDWTKLTGASRDTSQIVLALGLTPLSTGNLRRGAKVFGWSAEKVGSIHRITAAIARWAAELVKHLESV